MLQKRLNSTTTEALTNPQKLLNSLYQPIKYIDNNVDHMNQLACQQTIPERFRFVRYLQSTLPVWECQSHSVEEISTIKPMLRNYPLKEYN